MNRPECIGRIEEAIEAGPTPGPWEAEDAEVHSKSVRNIAECIDSIPATSWSGTDYSTYAHCKANAQLIAAANPSALKELLAYVRELEKDAGRLDYLDSLGNFQIEDRYKGPVSIMQNDEPFGQGDTLRGAIDAAIASQSKDKQ